MDSLTIFFLLLIPLVMLCFASIYISLSGFLPGRMHLGWIMFIFILVLTYETIGTWMVMNPGPINRLMAGMFATLIFGSQAPLLVELIARGLLADRTKSLKLLQVHSDAERLVAQDDLPGAIRKFEQIVAESPKDIDLLSRLADLLYQNGDHRKSAETYQTLLVHAEELDVARHCSILTRLSELYANQLGDDEMARRCIQGIINEHPGTRYARYAANRLQNL
jgi:tetratricopeptide (TPR) repeat protein